MAWDGYRAAYKAWHAMHARCTNPEHRAYKWYGGRGIKVCARWRKFAYFLLDMGECPSPELSLDRYPDNDGDYKKSNCRWADRSQQALNKRPVSDETKKVLSEASQRMWANRSKRELKNVGAKISEAQAGKAKSKDHVKALRESYQGAKGKKRKAHMSKLMKGRTFSEETRRKMSEAAKKRHQK